MWNFKEYIFVQVYKFIIEFFGTLIDKHFVFFKVHEMFYTPLHRAADKKFSANDKNFCYYFLLPLRVFEGFR